MKKPPIDETVRRKLHERLSWSGLLEYGCRRKACDNQVFSTWEIDVTCNECGKRMASRYELDRE